MYSAFLILELQSKSITFLCYKCQLQYNANIFTENEASDCVKAGVGGSTGTNINGRTHIHSYTNMYTQTYALTKIYIHNYNTCANTYTKTPTSPQIKTETHRKDIPLTSADNNQ